MTKFKTIKELSGAVTNHKGIRYPSGISQFDKYKVEFVPGHVVLVGSRPAMGRIDDSQGKSLLPVKKLQGRSI